MIEQLINEFSGKTTYVDVRIHELKREVIILENGTTNNIYLNNKSYGVRVLYKGGWGLAYSQDLSKSREVFNKALKMAKLTSSKDVNFKPPSPQKADQKVKYEIDPFSIEPVEKIKLLKKYESILSKDPKIKNQNILLINERVNKQVIAPSINVKQEFTNNIIRPSITAREGDVIQQSFKTFSKLGGYEDINGLNINDYCNEIIERVNRLLKAKSAKPEQANIVCDPQMTGLFFHEAVGHACEADSVLSNSSVLKDKLGELVASEEVNLVDDPTIMERGFYWYDDEGVKASPTPLITKGVLTGFMQSLKTANQMNVKPSGNGRSMNAENSPIPRMSNTVLKPGKWSVEELIKELGDGYYVKGFNGGVVDPISGQFSFGANECFRISKGEVKEPLRDVTLAGDILTALKGIKVAKDATHTRLGGTCGKMDQLVRVGDYCPSILVKEVIVGGSA